MFSHNLLSLSLLVFVRAERLLWTQRFDVLQNKRHTNTSIVEIKTASSIIKCAMFCSESEYCCGASYFDGKCQLNGNCTCAIKMYNNSYVIQKHINNYGLSSACQCKVVKTLEVENGGPWGTWGTPEFCEAGNFGIGYSMKIEPYQGDSDDSAMNGISIKCAPDDGLHDGSVLSGVAPWGSWSIYENCQKGETQQVLTAFVLRVEPYISGDDTAANDIKFKCRDINAEPEYEITLPPGSGLQWGSWGSWSESCPLNSAICGIQTKVEPPVDYDDTALNDVKFFCCLRE